MAPSSRKKRKGEQSRFDSSSHAPLRPARPAHLHHVTRWVPTGMLPCVDCHGVGQSLLVLLRSEQTKTGLALSGHPESLSQQALELSFTNGQSIAKYVMHTISF